MKEFDFVGSTATCEVCRKEFELYDNDIFQCEECHEQCLECKEVVLV